MMMMMMIANEVGTDDDDVECNDINDRENDSYDDNNISMLVIILNHLLKL